MDVTEIYKNDEEIHMVLVISEYFTKTVKIYPIKTKSAEEIAGKLWLWIAQFGPPKSIISDQGREFVNKVIDKLLNIVGTERRITSAYNPR